MANFIATAFALAVANWKQVVIVAAIIVSSVIFIVGGVKTFVRKINNPKLRKVILAFTSLALIFPVAAIAYLINKAPFEYYLLGCIALMPCVIVSYWLYEYTLFRDLVDLVASKTIGRLVLVFAEGVIENDNRKTQEKLINANKELKDFTANEINKTVLAAKKKDNDLSNL